MRRGYQAAWGAHVCEDGVRFRLWAPAARSVAVVLFDAGERVVPMTPAADAGWHEVLEKSARAGSRYLYEIDGELRVADPASRFQPEGPERAGEVVDPYAFEWPEDEFVAAEFPRSVVYELHVGAFTPQGTYAAACPSLSRNCRAGCDDDRVDAALASARRS